MGIEEKSSIEKFIEGYEEGLRGGKINAHLKDASKLSNSAIPISSIVTDPVEREIVLLAIRRLVEEFTNTALSLSNIPQDPKTPQV